MKLREATQTALNLDLILSVALLVLLVALRNDLCTGTRRKSLLFESHGRLAAPLLSNQEWLVVITHYRILTLA